MIILSSSRSRSRSRSTVNLPFEWFVVFREDIDVGHREDEDEEAEDLEAGLGHDLDTGGPGLRLLGVGDVHDDHSPR